MDDIWRCLTKQDGVEDTMLQDGYLTNETHLTLPVEHVHKYMYDLYT